ncbi:hypothetical protein [Bradyrhizobium sp. WSM2254]|uniref:hypothetical protein n=1 Tax=Bradyrhizobium sp. WSM2254 TaxID=1188263 RepID=UPI0006768546|nr:hypothetical protein [Bradyrhizobium sp. WSM2254]
MIDVSKLPPRELLALHSRVAEELRARGITRSSNNPTGDLAEYLFCKAFGWTQAGNSNTNIDATAPDGARYQIKGRRTTRHNKSRQLGSIREFEGKHFDFLAAVLFTESYDVLKAALIPYSVVAARATFVPHTNSHKFILHDDVWKADGVRDVTAELGSVELI